MTLINQGDLGLQLIVGLSVSTESGQLLGSLPIANGALLWPGETAEIGVDFGQRLVSGGLTGDEIPLCDADRTH